ncbi:MAG: 1-deoxy-D-xylulose-5-phosphate synthase, partial [Burkholderiaceae bacterium]|nr:1-deoxy-D-xylulose-5-phosphate synthase [Burkholderiaceae bacterium]
PATMFEEFGFNYIGPIDGHDLDSLVPTLQNLKHLKGPQFLHVVTKKGQGYKLAEAEPILYHGTGKFNPAEGIVPAAAGKVTYTEVFGNWLCDMAAQDKRLVGITPAMREGSGMVRFEQQFPERYFDVGIAEQHAVTFGAGLACEGLKPVVAIYSTFLQRGYDQLIHDVALQNLDVTFALDRAGLVGADGATHAGNYDIAFLRCIPNMVIMAPSDENECRKMLTTAYQYPGPAAVRYPRGAGTGAVIEKELSALEMGVGQIKREGKKIAILAFGTMVAPSVAAAGELDATVADMRFVKPLDVALVRRLAQEHDYLVTVEEGCIMGGAGAAVAEALAQEAIVKPLLMLGLPDKFIDHGDTALLLKNAGLDAAGILASIRARFAGGEPRLAAVSNG